jgi:uncharacterized protein YndB with AHSA1/START domain
MGATTHSIDVNAPLQAVYNQWTQFEEFPNFMEGVDEVRQEGPKNLLWKVNIGGKEKQWEAEITEQVPDQKIAWSSIDGTPNTGEVNFDSLDGERTRITLTMEYEPEGFLEKAGDMLGIPSGRVEGDLKRFRDFIEKRGSESGGWRGTIGEEVSRGSIANPEEPGMGIDGTIANTEEPARGSGEETITSEGREELSESSLVDKTEDPLPANLRTEQRVPLKAPEPAIAPSDEPDPFEAEQANSLVKPEIYPDNVDVAPAHEQIARRAYELYLERGQLPGHEREDWLEAERQLAESSAVNTLRDNE